MAFADKKGIVVASPFKLQAESMLDVRQQVDTIEERDELVTIKAATAGLRVYVKETKKSYVYNGTSWDELSVGNASLIVKLNSGTSEGTNMFTYNGTTNKTINITAAGIGAAGKTHNHTKSEITDFPTSLKNPQALKFTGAATASYDGSAAVTVNIPTTSKTTKSLIVTLNGGTTEGTNKFTFNGSAEKTINITPSTIGAAAATHTHDKSQITGLTAGRVLISDTNGHPAVSAVTSTELGYIDGVTSNIQTQLNGKAASTHTHNYAGSSSAGGSANSAVKLATARKINGTSFDGTKDINIQNNYFESVSEQNLNSFRTYGEYYGAGGNDCTNRPSGVDSFYLKIFRNASGYTAQSLYSVGVWYSRYYDGSSWSTWSKQYSSTSKPTASEIGAASSSHTHTKSQITDFPTSLKNPNALTFAGAVTGTYDGSKAVTINIPTTGATTKSSLTIQLNGGTTEGTNKFTFNGGTAKTINITPASIGAAAASHGTHVTYGTSAPKANGTASAGSATSVSRSDHVHPLQTTVSGNAGSATKLATARSIRTNLASTTAASFNGTADITPGITGTLPISHGGTGATTAIAANYNILKDTPAITDGWSDDTAIAFISASPNTTQGALRKYKALDMWNDWLNAKVGGSYALKSHTHNYLPLSGGTVTGNVILQKGSYVHHATGTDGASGYVNIATIKVSKTYQNIPIAFEIFRRGTTQSTRLYLTFNSVKGTDPTINKLLFDGHGVSDDFAIAKNATSTWYLYIRKTESYDDIAIAEYHTNFSYMSGVAITWTNTHANSLPSGATKATKITEASVTPGSLTIQFNGANKATFNGSSSTTVNITPSAIGAAASSHNHSASNITSGTLPVSRGGTGITANPSMLTNLGSTTAAGVFQTSPRPGITGTLAIAHGGTGATSASAARTALGAAAASHTHNYAGSSSAGGAANSAVKLNTARKINGTSFDGTKDITLSAMYAEDLSNKDVSLNTYNLSSGSPKVKYYYCPSDGAGDGITGRPNDNQKNAFFLICQSIRFSSTSDYITKQTYIHGSTKTTWERYCVSGTWSAWGERYTSQNKPTASEIGAATSSHTHNYAGSSSAGGAANSVKSSLTLQFNGTTKATFNGSAAATVNITPSSIGAAASSHTHNYAGSSSAGGAANSVKAALTLQLNGSTKATFNGSTAATVNITASSIGAAASNHTHSYLPLSGGTVTGDIGLPSGRANKDGSTPLAGSTITNLSSITKLANYKTVLGSYTDSNDKWYDIISVRHRNGNGDGSSYGMYLKSDLTASGNLSWGKQYGSSSWQAERTLIDSSNYGSWCAAKSHTHNYAGSSSAGGAATSANKVPVPVGTVLFSTSSSTTFFNSCFGGTWEVVGNIDAILGSSSTLTLYMFRKKAA